MLDRLFSGAVCLVCAAFMWFYVEHILKKNANLSVTKADLYSSSFPRRFFLMRLYAYRRYRWAFSLMALGMLVAGVVNLVVLFLMIVGLDVA